jgi:hypothetical protein
MIVRRTTTKLDGTYLVLNLLEYDDKSCRAEVVYSPAANPTSPGATIVMIQQQPSVELAVAAIARDFSTFATRTLASLPTIGQLADPDDDKDDDV